jgi:hypothetical protein
MNSTLIEQKNQTINPAQIHRLFFFTPLQGKIGRFFLRLEADFDEI